MVCTTHHRTRVHDKPNNLGLGQPCLVRNLTLQKGLDVWNGSVLLHLLRAWLGLLHDDLPLVAWGGGDLVVGRCEGNAVAVFGAMLCLHGGKEVEVGHACTWETQ